MPAECPVHAYQLDFTSLNRTSATFGSARRNILSARSDGDAATPRMASARTSARSEGNTPRPPPDYDPLRKHTFRASLNTSGRKSLRQAPCPVHSYADPPSSLSSAGATAFSRAGTGRGLPPLPQAAPRPSLLAPDYDAALRPGTVHATFSSVPRQLGARVATAPVHAYATPSPMGKAAPKATFGTDPRFDAEQPVGRAAAHAHHTPSPMGKKAFKATFGTAARFGSGSCDAAAAARPLPPRPHTVSAAATVAAAPPPPKKIAVLVPPTAAAVAEEKEAEPPIMPLSARLSAMAAPSPWRNALPLPEILPAEVAGAA